MVFALPVRQAIRFSAILTLAVAISVKFEWALSKALLIVFVVAFALAVAFTRWGFRAVFTSVLCSELLLRPMAYGLWQVVLVLSYGLSDRSRDGARLSTWDRVVADRELSACPAICRNGGVAHLRVLSPA